MGLLESVGCLMIYVFSIAEDEGLFLLRAREKGGAFGVVDLAPREVVCRR